MTKLKMIAAAGATALLMTGAVAGQANAQSWRHYDHRESYSSNLSTSYVDSLEWRINNAAQQGRISRGERRDLMAQLRSIQPLAWRVQTGQASPGEYRRLQYGVSRIEAATNSYAYNGGGRYDRRW